MTKGGYREGAGRPKTDNKRVTLSVRVKQETKDILTTVAHQDKKSIGKLIDLFARLLKRRRKL